MKKQWVIGLIGWFFLIGGCYESKVDRFRLELMEKRLTVLEDWQQLLNENIQALQGLVEALNTNKYITSVTETPEGYTLVLNDRSVLQISHGRKGEDGSTDKVVMPVISVRDSSDGHTYWTVDDELLRDAAGRAARADGEKGESGEQGEQGEQGPMGILPQVRINTATDIWEISVDKGVTWTPTEIKATGEKGEPGITGPQGPAGPQGPPGSTIFVKEGITIADTYVEFTLADRVHTKFRLPLYRTWALQFPEGTVIRIPAGTEKSIPFIISGTGGVLTVNAAGDRGWQAEVEMETGKTEGGVIRIISPASAGNASVFVFLNDGLGGHWTYRLETESF